jgi:hypothetical protein
VSNIKKFQLTTKAIAYIRECLTDGQKILSRSLQELPVERGNIIAFLPDDSSPFLRMEFHTGGITSLRETKKPLIEFIANFLDKGRNCYLILENALALPSDGWLKKKQLSVFFCENTVCHFLKSGYNAPNTISDLIREADTAYLTVGILTCAEDIEIQVRQEVSPESLEILVKRAEHILVSAYDGESFLIWSNNGSSCLE